MSLEKCETMSKLILVAAQWMSLVSFRANVVGVGVKFVRCVITDGYVGESNLGGLVG